MPLRDLYDLFNHMFAEMDAEFRDFERDFGLNNAFPRISLPAIKTYCSDVRTFEDNEKRETYVNGKLHGEVKYKEKDKPSEYYWFGKSITEDEYKTKLLEHEEKKEYNFYLGDKNYKVSGKKLKEIENLLESDDKIKKIENKSNSN